MRYLFSSHKPLDSSNGKNCKSRLNHSTLNTNDPFPCRLIAPEFSLLILANLGTASKLTCMATIAISFFRSRQTRQRG
ncbi:hypothetical protein M433DRAFT_466170 [Acidomyces richmondensis BFW]|nr:hypothetical protein M433DRAFT_466170 [Acidomyces richmondensis BFW]